MEKNVKCNIYGKLLNVVITICNLSPLLFSIFLCDLESLFSTNYEGLPKFKESVHTLLDEENVVLFLNLFILLYANHTIALLENERQLQLAIKHFHGGCCKKKNAWLDED